MKEEKNGPTDAEKYQLTNSERGSSERIGEAFPEMSSNGGAIHNHFGSWEVHWILHQGLLQRQNGSKRNCVSRKVRWFQGES